MNDTKYSIDTIARILTAAGCDIAERGAKVYVNKTPNGGRGQYGYCVAGDDIRDVTENITKRNGEISSILRNS